MGRIARLDNLGAALKPPGFEFPDECSEAVRAERMPGTEAVASESLADDDPEVAFAHCEKRSTARRSGHRQPRMSPP